jgi:hypothetical protein
MNNDPNMPWGSTSPNPDSAIINPQGLKGLWIPGEILHSESLTWQEKILLTYIYHLDSTENHCYASNRYLGELMSVNERTIANVISSLRNKKVIETVSWNGKIRKLRVTLC